MSRGSSMMVFTGNANPKLAADVVRRLGIPLGAAKVGRFSDGEVNVELQENVRGKDIFVLQSTCTPTNDNLMELLVLIDALKRASAARITAAIPYFGYARQDRRPRSVRVPITAKVVANMLQAVGVQRVLTMDLHADQIQGFFDIPVDNVYGTPMLLADLEKQRYDDLLVISPDIGGVVRARAFASAGCDLLFLGDDIGMQRTPMMSMQLYCDWLKPRLRRVIDAARAVSAITCSTSSGGFRSAGVSKRSQTLPKRPFRSLA